MPSDPELLLLPEVSELTRTPVDTLRYWRHNGVGPPSFKLGRRVVYRRDDVLDWIEQQASAQGVDVHRDP